MSELAETEIPTGFERLNELQTSSIDVYYNNQHVGSFITEYNFEKLRFNRPELIVAALSGVTEPHKVIQTLADWLNPNISKQCQPRQTSHCGYLHPEVAGVIFYEEQFRADLFINPLLIHGITHSIRYLPVSSAKPALLQNLTANFSGDNSPNSEDTYNFAGKSLLGWSQNYFESSWNQASHQDFTIATLSLNRDAEGRHYSAGVLQSRFGFSQFIYSRPILGISLGTSEDTLLNKDALISDPIDISLPTQALVEVYRDNLLIYSELLEGGQQQLNTQHFPYGTYDIVIKAKTPSGITLFEERRLFVKQTRIRTGDYRGWFFESGQMTTPSTSGVPDTHHTWITRLGYETGLRRDMGARFSVTSAGKDLISESELGFTRPGIWLTVGVLLGKEQQGGSLSSELTIKGALLQGHLRRIWKNRPECDNRTDNPCLLSSLKTHDTVSISSSLLWGRIFARYSFREQEGRSEHSKSISYYQQFFHQGIENIGCNFEINEQDDVLTFRVSIDVTFDLLNWRHQASAQYQEAMQTDNRTDRSHRIAMRSHWSDDDPDRTHTMQGSIGLDKTHTSETVSATLNTQTSTLLSNITATYSQSEVSNSVTRTSSYLGYLSTSMTVDKTGVSIGGTDLYDCAINVSVRGAKPNDTFHVLVDDHIRGFVAGSGTTVVPLPPFRSYQVTLENAGEGFFEGHHRSRTVTLYPGNVAQVEFEVWRTLVVYGRLMDNTHQRLTGYCYNNREFLSCTDQYGLFQLEISEKLDTLKFRSGNQHCRIQFNPKSAEDGILDLGNILCH